MGSDPASSTLREAGGVRTANASSSAGRKSPGVSRRTRSAPRAEPGMSNTRPTGSSGGSGSLRTASRASST